MGAVPNLNPKPTNPNFQTLILAILVLGRWGSGMLRRALKTKGLGFSVSVSRSFRLKLRV